jgi:hypothetical protein
MKWALFRGFSSSLVGDGAGVCVGRNLVIRENNEGCWGGGFFKIDFPGTGSIIADDEGGPEVPTEEEDIGTSGSGVQKESWLGIEVARCRSPGQGRIAISSDQK